MTLPDKTSRQPTAVQPTWTARPERGSEWLLRLMYRIAMFAGRPIAGLFLWPIAAYFWLTSGPARADSARYLTRILGRTPKWRETYKHFHTFSIAILDRFYFLSHREREFKLTIFGEHFLQDALKAHKGGFLVGGHLGTFEALRSLGRGHDGLRVGMAMFEENAHKIRRLLTAIDPSLLDDIIPLGHMDSMIQIQHRLEQGHFIGFLADRSFAHDATIPVDFLGSSAPFPTGAFRMASVMRRPVIFMTALYLGGNHYELHFDPLIDFTAAERGGRSRMVATAVKLFAERLEHYCRMAPYNWFNFYDFWAPRANAGESPLPPASASVSRQVATSVERD